MDDFIRKLNYLNSTKNILQESLNSVGYDILDTDTLRDYSTKIDTTTPSLDITPYDDLFVNMITNPPSYVFNLPYFLYTDYSFSGLTNMTRITSKLYPLTTEIKDPFKGCTNLLYIDNLDISNNVIYNPSTLFQDCPKIKGIYNFDCNNTSLNLNVLIFSTLVNLEEFTFKTNNDGSPMTFNFPGNIYLARCKNLTSDGLIKLFNSLPFVKDKSLVLNSIVSSKINYTMESLATERGWSLVYYDESE